jgi:hypothetical protein
VGKACVGHYNFHPFPGNSGNMRRSGKSEGPQSPLTFLAISRRIPRVLGRDWSRLFKCGACRPWSTLGTWMLISMDVFFLATRVITLYKSL